MARAVSTADVPWTGDQIVAVLALGGPIVTALAQKQVRSQSFIDIVISDPNTLRRWSSGRSNMEIAREQRIFAKVALSLLEASEIVDVGRLAAAPAAASPVAATPGPSVPTEFTDPNPVTRTKKRGVAIMHAVALDAAAAVRSGTGSTSAGPSARRGRRFSMKEAMDIVFAGGRMQGGEPEDEWPGVPANISEAILDRAECLALLAEAQAASDAAKPVSLELEEQFVMIGESPQHGVAGESSAGASGAAAGSGDVAVQLASAPM
jgi:hypothetical protein